MQPFKNRSKPLSSFLIIIFVPMKSSSQKSYTVREATIKLMQFCAYRDRSHKEVEEKLRELRMIPQAQEQIIIQLIQEDFLNEERFARSFVRGKFRIKKWGRIKIIQELKVREISKPIIEIALTEIEEQDYRVVLKELAKKKMNLIREKNLFKKKKKLSDYLIQRGYESNLVYETVNTFIA